MKDITVLGSTGSVGVNTLDVILRHPEKYSVKALTANTNVAVLRDQCIKHMPEFAVMVDEDSASKLEQKLRNKVPHVTVLSGVDGLLKVVELADVDYVMAAIVGAAGLLPTLAAAEAGKRVLLANKEALVMSGKIFMDTIQENNAELLPIDSEHNAIFQCMPIEFGKGIENIGVKKILLTASGGPFRTTPLEQLSSMTPDQACAHPNWDMGRKISVDSATMMNKGLEVIEACWLFHICPDFIQIVIHPQSVIHSLVEYNDGSVLAQLGNPDMRTPIAYGLAWPERIDAGVERLNLFDIAQLDFVRPDEQRFPCLRLAREAMQQGGTSSAILNAANEVAVNEFLQKRIRFTDISRVIESVLENVTQNEALSLEVVLKDDALARDYAMTTIRDMAA
ncbi:MAG: 1-deoxy-D-xylulose-5-phosphate reductoisomerase [Proteobacteria bacterium]|nr:1-deoxy-D-xylulose-5-phosphate reductoisomerase [Pseudomonadota bacterium]